MVQIRTIGEWAENERKEVSKRNPKKHKCFGGRIGKEGEVVKTYRKEKDPMDQEDQEGVSTPPGALKPCRDH